MLKRDSVGRRDQAAVRLARKSDDGALDVGTSIFARIPLRSLLGGAVGVLVGTLRHAANERVDDLVDFGDPPYYRLQRG